MENDKDKDQKYMLRTECWKDIEKSDTKVRNRRSCLGGILFQFHAMFCNSENYWV